MNNWDTRQTTIDSLNKAAASTPGGQSLKQYGLSSAVKGAATTAGGAALAGGFTPMGIVAGGLVFLGSFLEGLFSQPRLTPEQKLLQQHVNRLQDVRSMATPGSPMPAVGFVGSGGPQPPTVAGNSQAQMDPSLPNKIAATLAGGQ